MPHDLIRYAQRAHADTGSTLAGEDAVADQQVLRSHVHGPRAVKMLVNGKPPTYPVGFGFLVLA